MDERSGRAFCRKRWYNKRKDNRGKSYPKHLWNGERDDEDDIPKICSQFVYMIRKHLSKETRQKISRALKGRPLSEANKIGIGNANRGKKKDSITQENHWNWKGGFPKCIDCHKRIVNRSAKRCVPCNGKCRSGNKSSFWKGGISKQHGYSTFMSRKRKIAKKGNGGSHTLIEWLALKIKYNFMCLCCKKTEPEIVLTEDHIIPISKGGTDDISNIQPLCFSCNSIKSVKVLDFRNIFV